MLRLLAVDDEVPALEELAYLLRQDPHVGHVSALSDPAAALRDLGQMVADGQRLDGVFLDIRMPRVDGLHFARLLAAFSSRPRVVFVTAHDDCAVEAFELAAVDYLLKPVRQGRLREAVRRIAAPVAQISAPSGEDETIPVELGGRMRFVSRSAVCYAEAQGDYVRLHTAAGSFLLRMSLVALARRWESAGFVRIHRSTLVNVRHISELRLDSGRVMVQMGSDLLPVSRRHTREVRDLLVRQFRRPPAGQQSRQALDGQRIRRTSDPGQNVATAPGRRAGAPQ